MYMKYVYLHTTIRSDKNEDNRKRKNYPGVK